MHIVLDFFKNLIGIFTTMKFPQDYIDIILVAVIVYYVMKFAKDTRVGHLIRGIVLILVLYEFSIFANLSALTYILKNTIQLSFIAIIIVFQPELRSGLERIGRVKFSTIRNFQSLSKSDINTMTQTMIDSVCESCHVLSGRKIGALIVLEMSSRLGEILDTGVTIDAAVTPQALITIFFPNTPLHDGAVIIRENRIASAGCLLPLSKDLEISKELGTRHRAAVGITEMSDAISIVVSEETGEISYALNGKINIGVSIEQLKQILGDKFIIDENSSRKFKLFRKEVNDGEN